MTGTATENGTASATGRVLHVGKFFPPHRGGMETFLADLMAAQKRQGLEPAALVHSSDRRFRASHDEHPVDGQAIRITRAAVWLNLVFAPLAPGFLITAARVLREFKPDVLHLHMPNASVFWLLLLPAARKLPWIIHWHSDVVASPHSRGLRLLYPFYRPWEQATLRRAETIIATSPPYRESSEALRDHQPRCVTIPLGLDDSALQQRRPSEPPGDADTSPLRLLAIGRLTYYKGFQVLLEALSLLPEASLTLIGAGDQESALRDQIQRLGLGERVTLRGAVDEGKMADALRDCDLLCQPSLERTEAFGLVLLEAMALGKPVLASDIPGSGMPWLVRSSGAGELVPPGDAAALAAAIDRMDQDRDKLRALGTAGRDSFNAAFRIEVAAAAVAEQYARILPKVFQVNSDPN